MSRELTREEKRAIRKLVFSLCANYDREYGCLPLDGPCYMLGKCWTGAYCRYFRDAVLPNDPVLEAALTAEGPVPETRPCPICGRPFLPDGRTRYCSAACSATALRNRSGIICVKQGADPWKIRPEKTACIKAFRGRLWGGVYHFIPHPCFRKILSTF